jgi:hypothetical protein
MKERNREKIALQKSLKVRRADVSLLEKGLAAIERAEMLEKFHSSKYFGFSDKTLAMKIIRIDGYQVNFVMLKVDKNGSVVVRSKFTTFDDMGINIQDAGVITEKKFNSLLFQGLKQINVTLQKGKTG